MMSVPRLIDFNPLEHRRRKVHDYFLLLLCKIINLVYRETYFQSYLILFINQNVWQIMSFHLRYDGLMVLGLKILKLWRQESRPFSPGWAAHIMSIRSWTFRLPCLEKNELLVNRNFYRAKPRDNLCVGKS